MTTPTPNNDPFAPRTEGVPFTGPKPAARHMGNGKKPKKPLGKGGKITLGVLGSFILLGIGASMGGASEPAEPEVKTVTKEVEVEKIVEVEVTPEACIEALDLAGESLTILSDLPGMISEAAIAGTTFDTAAIEDIAGRVGTIEGQINTLTPQVGAASSECRASAK